MLHQSTFLKQSAHIWSNLRTVSEKLIMCTQIDWNLYLADTNETSADICFIGVTLNTGLFYRE